ncbi:MAG: hypothetical protein ACFFAN_01055 [Promethearchaeota archaeon]
MNFSIPRNNASELLLYIWKIIDLPSISFNDLLYKISFDLFIFSPQKATEFIDQSIKNNLLKKDTKDNLSLSENLKKKLQKWQINRKSTILTKFNLSDKKVAITEEIEKDKSSNFNALLKAFLDRGTLNRAAAVKESDFNIIKFDAEKGIIKTEVIGSKEETYYIDINLNNKILKHNCHDFQTRRAANKKFCKHIARLFLLLKERNEESAAIFLNKIGVNINEWEFLSNS